MRWLWATCQLLGIICAKFIPPCVWGYVLLFFLGLSPPLSIFMQSFSYLASCLLSCYFFKFLSLSLSLSHSQFRSHFPFVSLCICSLVSHLLDRLRALSLSLFFLTHSLSLSLSFCFFFLSFLGGWVAGQEPRARF